ncbi:MAG: anaerobic sulfite reductase subunit AsrA [Anaerorhabdus sp.]
MNVKLSNEKFDRYLEELSKSYRVYGPKRLNGKGKFAETDVIGYGEVSSLSELELNEKSYFSFKEIFYPIRETLFYFKDEEVEVPTINEKPIVIFLRPCDLNGVRKLDLIFLKNGDNKDFYYERRRKLVKFIMIECTTGFDNCFCVSLKANKADDFDGAVRFNEGSTLLKIVDISLETATLKNAEEVDFELEYIKENKIKVEIPDVDKVNKEHFNSELWKEYAGRCIACGRCNTSCVSCSCYTMQDVLLSDDKRLAERRRVWASCHVDGFTSMAGNHKFRDSNGDKMRFKTMHKINDFYKRFGEHMCVGCGRCDDVCPEYISFSTCINKLNEIVKESDSNE